MFRILATYTKVQDWCDFGWEGWWELPCSISGCGCGLVQDRPKSQWEAEMVFAVTGSSGKLDRAMMGGV